MNFSLSLWLLFALIFQRGGSYQWRIKVYRAFEHERLWRWSFRASFDFKNVLKRNQKWSQQSMIRARKNISMSQWNSMWKRSDNVERKKTQVTKWRLILVQHLTGRSEGVRRKFSSLITKQNKTNAILDCTLELLYSNWLAGLKRCTQT